MNILSNVEGILKKKHLSKSWLAEQLGIDKQNINKLLNANSIKHSTLENVAKILEVDIKMLTVGNGYEFDDNILILNDGESEVIYSDKNLLITALKKKVEKMEQELEKEKEEKKRLLELSTELVKKIKV